MPRTVLTVFLSSTGKDLESYRAEIRRQASAIEFFKCVAMEEFGPRDSHAVAFCTRNARDADLFVGLIGRRRGWEPPGDANLRSITEMEYDAAAQVSRPRFICLSPDDFPVPEHLAEPPELTQRQLAFRRRVGAERVAGVHNFSEPSRLAAEIMNGLLSHVISSDLIQHLRPDLAGARPEEAQKPVAAAFEALAADEDVDLLALARDPEGVDLRDLEAKLLARAQDHERKAAGWAETADAERRQSADYYKHVGALAFLNDTKPALAAYAKVVQLAPADPDGWNQLGHLLDRVGALDEAISAYQRLLALGNERGDQATIAAATGNLGIVYLTRGDLDAAEEMYRKSLALNEALGRKEGMARDTGNLGIVYQSRGDLDAAEEMFRKSLAIEEALGRTEGMATILANLGGLARKRGDHAFACASWTRSRDLFRALGSPNADLVEGLMREAGCES